MTKQRTRGRRPEMRIRKDGYAFVELIYNGKAKRRYLGKIRNAQDRRAYQKEAERIIGEYLANGRKAPITKSGEVITIRELSARYFAR